MEARVNFDVSRIPCYYTAFFSLVCLRFTLHSTSRQTSGLVQCRIQPSLHMNIIIYIAIKRKRIAGGMKICKYIEIFFVFIMMGRYCFWVIKWNQFLVEYFIDAEVERGICPSRIIIGGFSQGAAISLFGSLFHFDFLHINHVNSSYLSIFLNFRVYTLFYWRALIDIAKSKRKRCWNEEGNTWRNHCSFWISSLPGALFC